MNIIKDWDNFWNNRDSFKLGHLPTEIPNPKTIGLAELAQNDLEAAVKLLLEIDYDALRELLKNIEIINPLKQQIANVLNSKGKIFISGCGATGRLALMLEKLWRTHAPKSYINNVVGFMAGGDAALIKAIEGFEDHSEYAIRHVEELGFNKNDLMIGVTEGGETPFVIGTVEYAIKHSFYKPWLVYCNPDKALSKIKRSDKLIQSSEVNNLCLFVGNMALTGSTRMQATTVQTLAVGLALLDYINPHDIKTQIENLIKSICELDVYQIIHFINTEAAIYKNNGLVTYKTTKDLGLTVLTDTTERSPTFSTYAFENRNDKMAMPSLCFISIYNTYDPEITWQNLLERKPRTLEWGFSKNDTGISRLMGFDISENAFSYRKDVFFANTHSLFQIVKNNDCLSFSIQAHKLDIIISKLSSLTTQVLLKCILNIHSTLVMALLGKFQSNIMTHVVPSNNKLIDRSIRYVIYLLEQRNVCCKYDEVAQALYFTGKNMQQNESIVLKTVAHLISKI